MILRPYQSAGIEAIRGCIASGVRKILYVLPTGGGKTVIFSKIAKNACDRKKRVWIITHRQTLVRQTLQKLAEFGVHSGHSPSLQISVHMIQKLAKRIESPIYRSSLPDIVIIDEAHHSVSNSYKKIVTALPEQTVLLGVTATPSRIDGRGLGDCYDKIVLGPSVTELIDSGYLARYKLFMPEKLVDLSRAKMVAGDFNKSDVEDLLKNSTLYGDIIKTYERLFSGGKTALVFCISVAAAVNLCSSFNAAGIKAAVISANTPDEDTVKILQDLADGNIKVITSCDKLSEGVDVPSVYGVILARPTASLTIFMQQVGRVLRVSKDYEYKIIVDLVGNAFRHGLPCAEREWSLESKKKKRSSETEIKVKLCKSCFMVYRANLTACPDCGAETETAVKSRDFKNVVTDVQISETDKELIARVSGLPYKAAVGRLRSREELVAYAKARGYKPGWVDKILSSRK